MPLPAKSKITQRMTGVAHLVSEFSDPKDDPPPSAPAEAPAARRTRVKEERAAARAAANAEAAKTYDPKSDPNAVGDAYRTLFVGRLSEHVDEASLRREFERFGDVRSVRVVEDKEGNPRGYAFVEFAREDDFKAAYRSANGRRIEGKSVLVDAERVARFPVGSRGDSAEERAVDRIRETAAGTAIDATLREATTMIVVGVEGTIAAAAEGTIAVGDTEATAIATIAAVATTTAIAAAATTTAIAAAATTTAIAAVATTTAIAAAATVTGIGGTNARGLRRDRRRDDRDKSRDRGGDWGRYDERDRKRYRDEGGARDARDDKPRQDRRHRRDRPIRPRRGSSDRARERERGRPVLNTILFRVVDRAP